MMKKYIALGFSTLLVACQMKPQQPLKTQLEVREFQTRSFDTNKTDAVMSAVVEAFQDQGFMVKNVVPQVGLVAATREVDVEDRNEAFFQTMMFGANAAWGKNAIIDATANVKTVGNSTRVRTNFQEKVMNNRGGVDTVRTVEDPKFYQIFFDKVGKSIFLEKQQF